MWRLIYFICIPYSLLGSVFPDYQTFELSSRWDFFIYSYEASIYQGSRGKKNFSKSAKESCFLTSNVSFGVFSPWLSAIGRPSGVVSTSPFNPDRSCCADSARFGQKCRRVCWPMLCCWGCARCPDKSFPVFGGSRCRGLGWLCK